MQLSPFHAEKEFAMAELRKLSQDYAVIEQCIRYFEHRTGGRPSSAEVAHALNMSETRLHNLFMRWAGAEPGAFFRYLTRKNVFIRMTITRQTLASSGWAKAVRRQPPAFHIEPPPTPKDGAPGKKAPLFYGFHPTPFGDVMIAARDDDTVCSLCFVDDKPHAALEKRLEKDRPGVRLRKSPEKTRPLTEAALARLTRSDLRNMAVAVRGTEFQIKAWKALLEIPPGQAVAYEDIAAHIGSPGAVRAVGTAAGKNPVPLLIPCHRLIRKNGAFGNYGENPLRKQAILAWEAARTRGLL